MVAGRACFALGVVTWLATTALAAQPYAPPYYGQRYYGQGYYSQPYYAPPAYAQPGGRSDSSQPSSDTPQFRPIPPTNAQGAPPAYQPSPAQGRMPYGYPGYQPRLTPGYPQGRMPQSQMASTSPKIEWSLEEADPYLQQPVVLDLDVISSANLSTADLELPDSGDVLMKRLRGPNTTTRTTGGRREILNRFVVTLIPVRTGEVQLPPIKVSGELAGGLARRYEARTERPIRLQVRPSMTSVRPWLPLKSLSLKSSLDREGTLAPGQPVTLALEISAVGATAVQLPSLETQLNGSDFRAYREQTLTNTDLSPDGRDLLATRTEYYTLVPQSGGRFSLPEMSIAWWNVDRGVREVARLPLKTLKVSGGGPFGFSVSTLTSSKWAKVWVPLGGLLLLILGYWVGVLYRGRPFQLGGDVIRLTGRGLRAGYGLMASRWGSSLSSLRPGALLARAQRSWWRVMPASSHFLRCVHHANRAATAQEWCVRFEEASNACLRFKGELTQPALIRHVLSVRPGADPEVLRQLMSQLDAARYGRETIDFPRWKRQLMGQVRRGAGALRRHQPSGRIRWAALPALNPHA